MFIRANNTFVTKTSIALDSGITSLVLIPLPDAQESVEDIGRRLYGSLLGSAILVPHEPRTTISTGSVPLSKKFEGVFSSSPLSSLPESAFSSPPESADEAHQDSEMYGTGKLKRIYKTDKSYALYQSKGPKLIMKPPLPPPGMKIPAYSIFSHVFDDPYLSKKVQLWIYMPKDRSGECEWKPAGPGTVQKLDDVSYKVQWKDGKGASWVKPH